MKKETKYIIVFKTRNVGWSHPSNPNGKEAK